MAIKTRVNQALKGLSGHVLVRASRAEELQRKAARPKPEPAKPEPPKPKSRGSPSAGADYDDEAKEIIRAVRPYTMTGHDKLFALIQAVRYVVRHDIPATSSSAACGAAGACRRRRAP